MSDRRLALVTGGSSGIGAATAEELARQGHDLVIVGRDRRRLDAVGRAVEQQGVTATTVVAELTGPAPEIAEAVEQAGRLDVFVHSAGDARSGTIEELDDDDWAAAFATKLGGAVRVTRMVAPPLRRSSTGAIVYVSGGAGLRPGPRHAAMGAVNAALLNLARSTALLLAEDGVRVNAVAPGPVRTPRWGRLLAEASTSGHEPAHVEADVVAGIPMGRIATAAQVAQVIAWLASPGASHLTGVIVPVDGGASIS